MIFYILVVSSFPPWDELLSYYDREKEDRKAILAREGLLPSRQKGRGTLKGLKSFQDFSIWPRSTLLHACSEIKRRLLTKESHHQWSLRTASFKQIAWWQNFSQPFLQEGKQFPSLLNSRFPLFLEGWGSNLMD